MKRLVVAAIALSCAPADPTASSSSPIPSALPARTTILGGAPDTADTSVVALLITSANGPQDDSECSGTVVSPHVVLTAAHCLAPDASGPIDHIAIFLGSDSSDPTQISDPSLFVDVAETHFDQDFVAGGLTHDIGVVVAASALSVLPMAMNHDSLCNGDVGTPVHVVGYGESTNGDSTSGGARRALDSKIFSVDDEHLGLDDVTCFGDSGGPTFVTKSGVLTVAGIHSYGQASDCIGIGEDTRVDRYVSSFVDPAISNADPGFLPSGCSASGDSRDSPLALMMLALVPLVRRRAKK